MDIAIRVGVILAVLLRRKMVVVEQPLALTVHPSHLPTSKEVNRIVHVAE
jgi:hypothetical protein